MTTLAATCTPRPRPLSAGLFATFLLLGLGPLGGLLPPATAAEPAAAPLESVFAHQGGLATWRGFSRLDYDLIWNFGGRKLADHQTVDLHTRHALVTAADGSYRLGSDGQEVWVAPNAAALAGGKMPARFYVGTPFYFFAIPFVFADPGVRTEGIGRKSLEGKEYDVTRVTFVPGTGDTPQDYYLLYADLATHEVHLVAYVVTYPAMRGKKTIEELEPHALVYDEWQEVNGLRVPRRGRFLNWNAKEGKTEGEPLGSLDFSNVRFSPEAPADSLFAKPADADAETDNSHRP